MLGVLEKNLARSIDKRLAVFAARASDGSLLSDEMSLRAAAYLAGEIILPCCCMLCNKAKLENIFRATELCAGREELAKKLAELVYHDLARCNGLG